MPENTILFPTDYSDVSRFALKFACPLARDWDAKLLIVHVSETEKYPVGELFDEDFTPPPQETAELEKVVPEDSSISCRHQLLVAEAAAETVNSADEIVKCAQDQDVRAIVMGTHGRSGLSHLLLGSVAESVVRQASCPVITVRQPPL